MDKQIEMEEFFKALVQEYYDKYEGLMGEMTKPKFKNCSYEEQSVEYSFNVLPWQENKLGNMHGGAICTILDMVISAMAKYISQEAPIPTVSLEVKFLREVSIGEKLTVKAKTIKAGKTLSHFSAEAMIAETGKKVATATATFMKVI